MTKQVLIHFQGVTDRHSWVIQTVGRLLGSSPKLIHCAVQIENSVFHATWDGVEELTIEEYESFKLSSCTVLMKTDDLNLYNARKRAETMSLIGFKVTLFSLWCKALRLPVPGWLCTDFVQIVLGDKPQHLSVDELYKTFELPEVWEP